MKPAADPPAVEACSSGGGATGAGASPPCSRAIFNNGDDMTYDEAMQELSSLAHKATRLAASHDGAPYHELRELTAEIDCLIDHNCTRAEIRDAEALYRGAKLAGLVGEATK